MQWKTVPILLAILLLTPTVFADDGPPPEAMPNPLSGLVVQIGLDEKIRTNEGCLIHGLDTDADRVEKIRESLRQKGVYGRVSVDVFDGVHLPYIDNFVNLLVLAPEQVSIAAEELDRVLTPAGVLLARTSLADKGVQPLDWEDAANGWSKYVKPVPENTDEWSHYLHGPDNNAVAMDTTVGPPKHLQFVAAPEWTRNHHMLNSLSAAVTTKGKLFYIVDEATASNMNVPGKWALVARDAYNGLRLWKKPLASWAWHQIRFRSGPPQVSRLLVADGTHVYAPLGLDAPVSQLDTATGKTLQTYDETVGAEELILVDDVLLVLVGRPVAEQATKHPDFKDGYRFPNEKALKAINTKTGEHLWTWLAVDAFPRPETLASDGERAYIQVADGILAFQLATGKVAWVYGDVNKKQRHELNFGIYTLVVADNVVLCNLSGTLIALKADTGEKLWQRRTAEHGFHEPLDIFVIDGLVWTGTNRPDSVAPPAVGDFDQGLDLHTGEVKVERTIMAELQTAGHHHRCYREKATARFIMTGKRGVEMMDLEDSAHFRANWVRGTCQFGYIPANGLIYAPPHSCGCYMESKLRGFNALAASRNILTQPERLVTDEARLVKGPAYSENALSDEPSPDAWPAYRHDPLRSSVTNTTVPTELHETWKAKLGGRLTQPVVANGKVVVASIDEHTVIALDETSGKIAWTFTSGGRIDSSPTLYAGRVYFGSADGRVYCLQLSAGELVWRFTCAPGDVRTAAYGQLESLWPVHGSVLILDGKLYASAGRSTWIDGGIYLFTLDPATGKILHRFQYQSRDPEFEEGMDKADPQHTKRFDQNTTDYKTFLQPDRSDSFSMAGGTISDVLVSDGQDVFLHQDRFSPTLEHQNLMARHLFSTSSLLDGAENHRSHYMLGTGDFRCVPVAYSWIVNNKDARRKGTGLVVPYGVLLAYDTQAVWGVRRNGKALGKYIVFQRQNTPFSQDEKGQPDFQPLEDDEHPFPYLWQKPFKDRPRAILKADGHLIIAATPVAIPKNDPHAAYEDRLGGTIHILDPKTGETIATQKLDHAPTWDALTAANNHLYLTNESGTLIRLGE